MRKLTTIKQQLARTINQELYKAYNNNEAFGRDYLFKKFYTKLVKQYELERSEQVASKLQEVIRFSNEIVKLKRLQIELLKEVSANMVQRNKEEITNLNNKP